MNVKIVVAAHGTHGQELVETLQDIMGRRDEVCYFNVLRSEPVEKLRSDFEKLINDILDEGNGVLILTDMLGGTPTNISMPFINNEYVEIITGVNLPMLITAVHKSCTVKDVRQLAGSVIDAGVKSMINCREKVDRMG